MTRAYHETVPLDQLRDVLLFEKQVKIDPHRKPLLGWAGLSFALLDLMGGVFGFSIVAGLMGSLFGGRGAALPVSQFVAVGIQIAMIVGALRMLHHAPSIWTPQTGFKIDMMSGAGLLIGIGLALILFVFGVASPSGVDASDLRLLRLADAIILLVTLLLLRLFAGHSSTNLPQHYQVIEPKGRRQQTIYRFEAAHLTAQPSVLKLDGQMLAKFLVFQSLDTAHYLRRDPAEPLALAEGEVLLVDLLALQNKIGTDVIRVKDNADVLACKLQFMTQASGWVGWDDKMACPIPKRLLNAFIDLLFNGEGLRSVLEARALQVLLDLTADVRRSQGWSSAQGLYESLATKLTGLQHQPSMTAPIEGIRNPALPLGSIVQVQAAYQQFTEFRRFVDAEWKLQWESVRTIKLQAERELPTLFHEQLVAYLIQRLGTDDISTRRMVEVLLNNSGLRLHVVECTFAPGAAQDCDALATRLAQQANTTLAALMDKLGDYIDIQCRHMAASDRKLHKRLITQLPHLMPYLQRLGSEERMVQMLSKIIALGDRYKTLPKDLMAARDPAEISAIVNRYDRS